MENLLLEFGKTHLRLKGDFPRGGYIKNKAENKRMGMVLKRELPIKRGLTGSVTGKNQ